MPISGGILKKKASKYARELGIETFKVSNGWFDRWKGRHGFVFKTVSGEAKSCTADMTASWEATTLPTILTNYQLQNIFNADKFGLFYKALPDKSLHLKSEKCIGGKHNKVCLSGMAAANGEGKKLPMFVIGKSVKPRCFTGMINLHCRYHAQKRAGSIVACLRNGFANRTGNLSVKEERLRRSLQDSVRRYQCLTREKPRTEVSAKDVADTDSCLLTSDIGSLNDEDILTEFCKENQISR